MKRFLTNLVLVLIPPAVLLGLGLIIGTTTNSGPQNGFLLPGVTDEYSRDHGLRVDVLVLVPALALSYCIVYLFIGMARHPSNLKRE